MGRLHRNRHFHFSLGPFHGGFVGVDIFFVISGYLITRLIVEDVERGRFSFKRFYVRRVRRLFPALFFTLFCSLLAAAVLFSPEQMTLFGVSLSAAVFSVSNILFWSEHGYFDVSSHLKPLLHTWSLSVEEQFYLLWPFVLVWLLRFGRNAALSALALIFVASFGANLVFEPYQSALFYLSPFRFFEFALGAGLVFVPAARSNASMEAALVCGLLLIAYAYRYFSEAILFPSYPALLPTVGACLAIWGGQARWAGQLLRNRAAVGVGLISYSLYLAHWPILVFAQYSRLEPIMVGERVGLLLLTFAVAFVMYRFIEGPFRSKSGTVLLPRSYIRVAATCAVVIAGVGIQSWATHGWLWRLGARGELLREFVAGDRIDDAAYGGQACIAPCSTLDEARSPDVIVIGDSHSRQYFLGAKVGLPELKVDFYEFSSCQFYSVNFTRDYTGYLDPVLYDRGCRAARDSAFAAVKRAPNALVIISEYWDPITMLSVNGGPSVPVTTPEAYYRFVGAELGRLRHTLGIDRMIVLGSVPTSAGIGSPIDCFGRPRVVEISCSERGRKNPIVAQRAKTNELLASSLPPGVTFIDPFRWLCDQAKCTIISDGPLYSDSTHLSGLGSKRVMTGMASVIRESLSGPRAQASK